VLVVFIICSTSSKDFINSKSIQGLDASLKFYGGSSLTAEYKTVDPVEGVRFPPAALLFILLSAGGLKSRRKTK
jgi:hypothetical protein